MRNLFLRNARWYRRLICILFGRYDVTKINIPTEIYGNFKIHYLGYDKDGNVQKGFKTLFEALRKRGNLGLTVLYD